MSTIMMVLHKLYALLTGSVLLEARITSIEEHISTMNEEMGRLDTRLGKIGEDVAYIRGRLDK